MILGGGRRQFVPESVEDVEDGHSGYRRDGADLLLEWEEDCVARSTHSTFQFF